MPRSSHAPKRRLTKHALSTPLSLEPTPQAATVSEDTQQLLRTITETVNHAAADWRDALAVSIGQASRMTGLEPAQIRYLETLRALQPTKMTAQEGASRLYTLTDLRRLYAFAQLIKAEYRPAEAAELVIRYASMIERGEQRPLTDLLTQEGNIITDGFVLARLISQLIDAVQAEFDQCFNNSASLEQPTWDLPLPETPAIRVVGVLLPMRPLALSTPPTVHEVQQLGRALSQNTADTLVALCMGTPQPNREASIPVALANTGRNDRTVLFYSRTPQALPLHDHYRYCAYVPACQPQRTMILILEADQSITLPHVLPFTAITTRQYLLDHILEFAEHLFGQFRQSALAKEYRYRSDGFEIELTKQSFAQLLQTIRSLLFPNDDQALATILIPNNLDAPASLSVLAHCGYTEALVQQMKLDLRGEGEGLCGQAYRLREPFLSLDVKNDTRVAYAIEEQSQVALAVPLATSWGISPFGVLYLASRLPTQTITSDQAYLALLLGNIFSELLGRWWLTRLRRAQDRLLHHGMQAVVGWFDSLDKHGPAFQQGLQHIQALWKRVDCTIRHCPDMSEPVDLNTSIALVVFDIDSYRMRIQKRSNDLFPLRAQQHVVEAIQRIQPKPSVYWFMNDHALLILDACDVHEATIRAQRIAAQVAKVPLRLPGNDDLQISVSYAVEAITYAELHDLAPQGEPDLSQRVKAIIDHLRDKTRHLGEPMQHSIQNTARAVKVFV